MAAVIVLMMLLPIVNISSFAADSSTWTFIDGENITRRVNMAVIYRDLPSSGQDQWGINIALDASGTVTEIYKASDKKGIDLKIPEGGAVISASGVRLSWFEDNVEVGSKLYYDGYTQKLFICDDKGKFDPFFTENATVSGSGNSFIIANPANEGTPPYTYDIAVDKDGVIVARGGGTEIPDGGFILSAATEDDRNFLIMYAPLGAKCVIKDGIATFTYSTAMLKKTVNLVFESVKAQADAAKAECRDIDNSALDQFLEDNKDGVSGTLDYISVIEYVVSIEKTLSVLCSETRIGELRGAFHTPVETDSYEVFETVTKAKSAGLNTIILRISNGYNTIVPLPDDNKFKQNPMFGGQDILRSYINACEQEGIALVICFDVYYNESAKAAAPEWITESNSSNKGLSEKYFSPGNDEFKTYYLDYVKYVITRYPEIKNIMFDSLRYPKFNEDCDIGYDYITMERFAAEQRVNLADVQAIKTELFDSPLWEKWVDYRKGLVSSMAQALSSTVRETRPDATVSVVAARDTVEYYYMQDALNWIDVGLFDSVCVTLYEGIEGENDPVDENAYYDGFVASKSELFSAYTGKKTFFFTGIESGRKLTDKALADIIAESRDAGSDGMIFSDLSEFIAQNYYTSLKDSALKGNAVSQFGDTVGAMNAILEYAKIKINGNLLASGAYDQNTANLACGKIDDAIELLSKGKLTYEQADQLREQMALFFAASDAKKTIVRDFEAISKIALIAKEENESIQNPPDTQPDGENKNPQNTPDNKNESGATSEPEENNNFLLNIVDNFNPGIVLIYAFVGIAFVVAIVGTIILIRRKGKRPPKHHMPKGFDGSESEE